MTLTVRKWMKVLKWLAILMAVAVFLGLLSSAYMSAPRRVDDKLLIEWLEGSNHGYQNANSELLDKLTDIVEDKHDVNITELVIDVHDAVVCEEFCVTTWYKNGANGCWYVTSFTDDYLRNKHRPVYDEIAEWYG